MRLRVPLLRVNEVRELGRISDEEDRGVIEDPIPVTLICPELDSEASGITGSVCRSRLPSNSGETDSSADTLSDGGKEGVGGDVTQVMGNLEITMGAGAFSMDLLHTA